MLNNYQYISTLGTAVTRMLVSEEDYLKNTKIKIQNIHKLDYSAEVQVVLENFNFWLKVANYLDKF